MTLKSDAKFEEKLPCCLENDMRNFANFHQSTWKCQNWNFDKILLSKVENVWTLNLQWSSCVMEMNNDIKIEEELTCRFKSGMNLSYKIWPEHLKSLKKFFNWLLVTKIYIVWHWRVMQVLKKDWPVVWKKTWEIWQIFTRALESVKIGTLMGSFCPK